MKTLLLFCASLLFDVGATTVQAHPAAAAQTVAASVDQASHMGCPEWLCRLLCGIVCGPGTPCCHAPGSGPSCCSAHCCGG